MCTIIEKGISKIEDTFLNPKHIDNNPCQWYNKQLQIFSLNVTYFKNKVNIFLKGSCKIECNY